MAYGKYPRKRMRRTRRPAKRRTVGRRPRRGPTVRTLAKRISTLSRTQTEQVRTSWSRQPLSIQSATTSGLVYMCPIPYSGCDMQNTFFPGASGPQGWSDNLGLAAQPIFEKKPLFGYSEAAMNSPNAKHTGGYLKYQIISNEPSLSKVTLALVQPHKHCADQLTVDRSLNGQSSSSTAPGSLARFSPTFDWVANTAGDTYFGATINRKFWKVLYQREMTFGVPPSQGGDFTGVPGITLPIPNQNGLTCSGTIKLPAGGMIRNVSYKNQNTDPARQYNPWYEPGLVDERNENTCYLIAIQNGISGDLEQIKMSFIVNDHYTVSI